MMMKIELEHSIDTGREKETLTLLRSFREQHGIDAGEALRASLGTLLGSDVEQEGEDSGSVARLRSILGNPARVRVRLFV